MFRGSINWLISCFKKINITINKFRLILKLRLKYLFEKYLIW